jgi:hypothetical protein
LDCLKYLNFNLIINNQDFIKTVFLWFNFMER